MMLAGARLHPSSTAILLSAGLLLTASAAALRADVTGEQVKRAVRRGVQAILDQQHEDGRWTDRHQPGGVTCLATLALLQAGESPRSPALAAALRQVRSQPNLHTYTTSLKVMVLSVAGDVAHKREIESAAGWLVKAQQSDGLWSYGQGQQQAFDHSNSQFALLGLHAAAQSGVRIPHVVWRRARERVLATQQADGGWAYRAVGESRGSMTAAGVSDLLILGVQTEQRLERAFNNGMAPHCGEYRTSVPLARGLEWLGRNFRADVNPGQQKSQVLYWLYAVERCGILSGQRYFGGHDWYREGAEYLVRQQGADGTWNDSLIETCFAILFLAKGHKSLLIQKLQWSEDDAWQPDRNDVSHLISYIDDKLGQPVTWQSIPFDAPLEDWLGAPVLYISGHTLPRWSEAQRAKLRAYVENGGTLLAEACCGREEFQAAFEQFAADAFPEAPLHQLGPDHALYHVVFEIEPYGPRDKERPYALQGIDLACRTAVIYSPRDLSCLWEQGDVPRLSERAMKLGTNIAAYAVGRRPLIDRLDAIVVPGSDREQAEVPPSGALRLAQVLYEGDWRPFPMALVQLAQVLRDELDFDVVTRYREVRLTAEDLYQSPLLYLTGHFQFELSEPERAALAGHLRRGGFLLADASCGTEPFDSSFRRLMRQMFPDAELKRLPDDHPIFTGRPGFAVTSVEYTPDVRRVHPELGQPELWGLEVEGRLAVVYSPYSLGCGLSGTAFDGCWGLASADARHLAANIVLYALTR